jgi:hypothetical protein
VKNLRFARLILIPSAAGLIGIILLALVIMVGAGLLFASQRGLIYDYIFGTGSSVDLIETSKSTISLFNEAVFGNPLLNKILFFVFWMVVGLVVYIVLSSIGSSAAEAEHALKETKFVHAQKARISHDFELKILLRLIAFGLLVIYGVLLIKILLPFGVLSARIVAGNSYQASSWLYGLLGFIVLVGSFYIGVVLLRFFMLRPRIFGGQEDIIADEIEHGTHRIN